jgi:hypothetical protein
VSNNPTKQPVIVPVDLLCGDPRGAACGYLDTHPICFALIGRRPTRIMFVERLDPARGQPAALLAPEFVMCKKNLVKLHILLALSDKWQRCFFQN